MAKDDYQDWRQGLSLVQRLQYMLRGKYSTDVTFILGEGEDQEMTCAHSFILVCGSSVLESILKKMSLKEGYKIPIQNVNPAAFKQMIRYLYTEEVEIDSNSVMNLLNVAKQYQVCQLIEKCVTFLEQNITVENVCNILNGSLQFDEVTLTSKCTDLISCHAPYILSSTDFLKLSYSSLFEVVKSDDLRGVSELDVHKACMAWADSCCENESKDKTDENRREVLRDVLFQIRYPVMSASEYARAMQKSSLLLGTEKLAILEHISIYSSSDEDCVGCTDFITRPRCGLPAEKPPTVASSTNDGTPSDAKDNKETQADVKDDTMSSQKNKDEKDEASKVGDINKSSTGVVSDAGASSDTKDDTGSSSGTKDEKASKDKEKKMVTVSRFSQIASGMWCCESGSHSVDFTCSKNVSLTAVSLYGADNYYMFEHDARHHDIEIKVLDSSSVLSEIGPFQITSDGGETPVPIQLTTPVDIIADSTYSIVVKLNGPITYCGWNRSAKVTTDDLTVTFSESSHESLNTDETMGQIPELHFTV